MRTRREGRFDKREPFSDELLRRVQHGALASRLTDEPFKAAVRATLERGAG